MGDMVPRELISLADDEGNSVTVSVLGRNPGWAAGLEAEIVVRTPFVSGRCYLALSVSKLDKWSEALGRLDAGEDVSWMPHGRVDRRLEEALSHGSDALHLAEVPAWTSGRRSGTRTPPALSWSDPSGADSGCRVMSKMASRPRTEGVGSKMPSRCPVQGW
ncbi:DUF5959 family protein [Streptomyces sp. NPDC017435]|uniref:DUF5959 family protein n=1 Tax=Streptomyces sp. NPDC017435 TaxID=3364995 RepID=UPI0037AC19AE